MESDLELLGVTAVEDELQDEVQLTLESLRAAGIKVRREFLSMEHKVTFSEKRNLNISNFHLEPLKTPAECSAEKPFTVLFRIEPFFTRV